MEGVIDIGKGGFASFQTFPHEGEREKMDSGPRVGARGQAFRRNDGLGDGEVRWGLGRGRSQGAPLRGERALRLGCLWVERAGGSRAAPTRTEGGGRCHLSAAQPWVPAFAGTRGGW